MRRLNPDAIERGAKPRAEPQGRRRGRACAHARSRASRAPPARAALAAHRLAQRCRRGHRCAAGRRRRLALARRHAGVDLRPGHRAPADGERRCGLSPAPGHRRRPRKNTPREVLLAASASICGQPILAIDPVDMKTRLESLPLGPQRHGGAPAARRALCPHHRGLAGGALAAGQQLPPDRPRRPAHQRCRYRAASPGCRWSSATRRRSTPPICSTCWRASPTSRRRVRGAALGRRAALEPAFRQRRRRQAAGGFAAGGLVAAGPARARAEPAGQGRQRHRPAHAGPPRGAAWPGAARSGAASQEQRRPRRWTKANHAGRNGRETADRDRAADLMAALDVGTTKVCCFIARRGEDGRPQRRRHRPPARRAACAAAPSSTWRRPRPRS